MDLNPAGTALPKTRLPYLAVATVLMATVGNLFPAAFASDGGKLLTEVHFDPGSVDVTPGGRQKVEKAIAAIRAGDPREIRIVGFADSTGDEAANLVISRERADSVANLLIEHGITQPLVIEGKGEEGAPYAIPDDVSEPLNRCVGIIIVGAAKKKPML